MQSNECQVKENDYMDLISVVADAVSLCGRQCASFSVLLSSLLMPLMSQREILSNESF